MQSSKLHNDVNEYPDKTKHACAHYETPYVVHLQNRYSLAPIQPLFTFQHPNRGALFLTTKNLSASKIFFVEFISNWDLSKFMLQLKLSTTTDMRSSTSKFHKTACCTALLVSSAASCTRTWSWALLPTTIHQECSAGSPFTSLSRYVVPKCCLLKITASFFFK